jgi:uncharacterized protein YjbI with pentapeptide repeats
LEEAGCTRTKKGSLYCSGLDLTGIDLSGCTFASNVEFHDTDLTEALFAEATFQVATFSRVTLTSAVFDGATWRGCGSTKPTCSSMHSASAARSSFIGADLSGLFCTGSDLSSADFTQANLDNTWIQVTNFAGSDFGGASLRGAYFSSSTLTSATFCEAILDKKTLMRHCTCPDGTWSGPHTCTGHLGIEACPS